MAKKGRNKNKKGPYVEFPSSFVVLSRVPMRSLEMQARGFPHEHQNARTVYENDLLFYFARSRPVARVHMATTPDRRACKGLRATWTLHCMNQLGRFDLSGCRGCGHYPTTTTCSNCATAWCHSCRLIFMLEVLQAAIQSDRLWRVRARCRRTCWQRQFRDADM